MRTNSNLPDAPIAAQQKPPVLPRLLVQVQASQTPGTAQTNAQLADLMLQEDLEKLQLSGFIE